MRDYRRMQQTASGRLVLLATLLKDEGILDRVQLTQDRYLSARLQALERLRPSEDLAALSVLATHAVHRQT